MEDGSTVVTFRPAEFERKRAALVRGGLAHLRLVADLAALVRFRRVDSEPFRPLAPRKDRVIYGAANLITVRGLDPGNRAPDRRPAILAVRPTVLLFCSAFHGQVGPSSQTVV